MWGEDMLLIKNKPNPFKKGLTQKVDKKRRNKKADLEGLIKIISWIVFFGIAIAGLYFLIKKFTG